MGAIGHEGGSYATIDKTPNYLGDFATQFGQNALLERRARQEMADANEKNKAEAKSKEANAIKDIDYLTDPTLNSSFEGNKFLALSNAKDKFTINKNIIQNSDDPVEKANAYQGIKDANDTAINYKVVSKQINDTEKEISDNVKAGKLDQQAALGYLNELHTLGENYRSENGRFYYDKKELDSEGNEVVNKKDLTEFLASKAKISAPSRFDKSIDEFSKNYKIKDITKGDSSGRNIHDNRVDRTKGSADYIAAEDKAKEYLSDPDQFKLVVRDNKLDPNNIEGVVAFTRNKHLDALANKYSDTQNENLNYTKIRDAKKDAEDKVSIESVAVSSDYIDETADDKKIHKITRGSYLPNIITVGIQNQKPIKNFGGSNSNLNGAIIQGINKSKNKHNQNYLITGKSPKNIKVKYNGTDTDLSVIKGYAESGDTEAQKIIADSYSTPDTYYNFTREVSPEELNSWLLGTELKNTKGVDALLKKNNPNDYVEYTPLKNKSTPTMRKGKNKTEAENLGI